MHFGEDVKIRVEMRLITRNRATAPEPEWSLVPRPCSSREEKEAVLVAGCYAAAEVVIVEQCNSTVRSTHTVEEVVVVLRANHQ